MDAERQRQICVFLLCVKPSQPTLFVFEMAFFDKPKMFYLPNTMANWPWPRRINPFFEQVKVEADEWFRSFNALSPKSLKAFEKCDFGWYSSVICTVPPVHLASHHCRQPVLLRWLTRMLRGVRSRISGTRDQPFMFEQNIFALHATS